MLVIRNEQIDSFGDAVYKTFCRRIEARIREVWPEVCAVCDGQRAETLDTWVHTLTGRARVYGLVSERAAVRYIDTVCLLGNGFEDQARYDWARRLLLNAALPGEAKAARLWKLAKAEFEQHGA
jgi:hypothetical protein